MKRNKQRYKSQLLRASEIHQFAVLDPLDIAATERIRNAFYSTMNETAFQRDPFSVLTDIAIRWNHSVNYLIVGECDGYSGGALETHLFSDDVALENWYGIMMEPVPINFQRLQHFLSDSKVSNTKIDDHILRINAAFSNDTAYGNEHRHKTMDLRVPDLEALAKAEHKNIDDIAHWIKYQIGSARDLPISHRPGFVTVTVPAMNAMDIHKTLVSGHRVFSNMDRRGAIDVLQVDTEGFDAAVVRNYVSWSKVHSVLPMFIQFEHHILYKYFPNELVSLRQFMVQNGYQCIEYGGDTRCYLRN